MCNQRTSEGAMSDLWTYRLRNGEGPVFTTSLELVWELPGDPLSGGFVLDEIDAVDLLRKWLGQCCPDTSGAAMFGPGMMRISWFVEGPEASHFEPAPFTVAPSSDEHFLTTYSWPKHAETGQPLNWLTLPVRDKRWHQRQADKGGFIQEATGWKPSPLQPVVHLPGLLAAVPGLSDLVRSHYRS
jgi:hypothetical protein